VTVTVGEMKRVATPYVLINVPIIMIKAFVGMFLYSTKVLCIGTIANWWFFWWSGTRIHQLRDDETIDTEILNDSIYVEILLETLPQVVIQVSNNMQISPNISEWSRISLFSISLTMLNTLNGIYRFFYFKCILHQDMGNIPVRTSLLGYLLFEAKPTDHKVTVERNQTLTLKQNQDQDVDIAIEQEMISLESGIDEDGGKDELRYV
jgi:hypothetical protein